MKSKPQDTSQLHFELDNLVRLRERLATGDTKANPITPRIDKLINIILDKLETIHAE